jgi:hypothetical protein
MSTEPVVKEIFLVVAALVATIVFGAYLTIWVINGLERGWF